MWQRLVDKKDEWIGGTLVNCGNQFDCGWNKATPGGERTKIVDLLLTEKMFSIIGQEFLCGGMLNHIGLSPYDTPGDEDTLTFVGIENHRFYMIPPKKALTHDPDSS